MTVHPVLREYEKNIDAVCGAMVRLCFSLPGQRSCLLKLASNTGAPLNALLHSASFSRESIDIVHTAPIQDQLISLEDGGPDEVLIGNVCVSYVYSMWEDKYRGQFAQQRGIEKNAAASCSRKSAPIGMRSFTTKRLARRRLQN